MRDIVSNLTDPLKILLKQWAPILVAEVIAMFSACFVMVVSIIAYLVPMAIGLKRSAVNKDQLIKLFFSGPFWVILAIIIIVILVVSVWKMGALISAISYRGEGMAPVSRVLKNGFKFFAPLFGFYVLIYFASVGGFFALIFPLFVLLVAVSFVGFLIVQEDLPIMQALGTSFEMTKGARWEIFGRIILSFIIIWAALISVSLLNAVPIFGMIFFPVNIALQLVIPPYMIAFVYCIYEDRRMVKSSISRLSGKQHFFLWGLAIFGFLIVNAIIVALLTLLIANRHSFF